MVLLENAQQNGTGESSRFYKTELGEALYKKFAPKDEYKLSIIDVDDYIPAEEEDEDMSKFNNFMKNLDSGRFFDPDL